MLEFRSFPYQGKKPREKTGRSHGVSILEIWSVFSLNLAWTHYVPSGLFPRSFPSALREKTGSCNAVFSLAVFSQNSYVHSKCLKSVFSLRCGLFPWEFRSFPWGKRPREKTGMSNGVSMLEIWSVFSLNLAWTHYGPSGLFPQLRGKRPEVVTLCSA